jgi:REP element-mobilizing transposase RayT
MKNNIFPLEPDHFYHVYNRGINGGQLFFNHQNYLYFLKLISEKLKPLAEIHSYCLLQNHFHLLVKIKSADAIRDKFSDKANLEIETIISQQFSNTFNSYSQAINKHFGRTGKLFELPFRRKKISDKIQLENSILYINKNAVKHKLVNDCLDYPYSSIHDIIAGNSNFVESNKVLAVFGGTEIFLEFLRK